MPPPNSFPIPLSSPPSHPPFGKKDPESGRSRNSVEPLASSLLGGIRSHYHWQGAEKWSHVRTGRVSGCTGIVLGVFDSLLFCHATLQPIFRICQPFAEAHPPISHLTAPPFFTPTVSPRLNTTTFDPTTPKLLAHFLLVATYFGFRASTAVCPVAPPSLLQALP